jgi:hypothetical protein
VGPAGLYPTFTLFGVFDHCSPLLLSEVALFSAVLSSFYETSRAFHGRGVHLAEELVFVADGAHWIWNHVTELFQSLGIAPEKVFELVDFYHAVEHLSKFAELKKGWKATQMFLPDWHPFPVVQSLQSLRGVSMIVAVTTVAEHGDLKRFHHPSELMGYLYRVPSENSTGSRVRRGPITKIGIGHVRRVPVEAAWAYRLNMRVNRVFLNRQEGLPQHICDIP